VALVVGVLEDGTCLTGRCGTGDCGDRANGARAHVARFGVEKRQQAVEEAAVAGARERSRCLAPELRALGEGSNQRFDAPLIVDPSQGEGGRTPHAGARVVERGDQRLNRLAGFTGDAERPRRFRPNLGYRVLTQQSAETLVDLIAHGAMVDARTGDSPMRG
jgi:hypothetical protein